ncbi:MAG: hypothetical protein LBH28_06935 [Oscillospiraceae bacterium]|nr:hypothetical protein [Oscillospiraceae bacterium]
MKNNTSQYERLRGKYPEFIYEGYDFRENGDTLEISYNFRIPGLTRFCPTWTLAFADSRQRFLSGQCLDELVFSLGMTELVSYWKTCCPPRVRVEPRTMTTAQKTWWKKLYRKGLGEYFYKNGIFPGDDFIDIASPSTVPAPVLAGQRGNSSAGLPKVLIPVGGGKDSAVTLELLRGHAERYSFVVNPRKATDDTIAAGGIQPGNVIVARRTLDKNMLALNEQGFLNGHTPFSAIVAFSSVLAGYINGLDFVALSNESSANESTVADSDVNHQYSKSFEFEDDFRQYEREYIGSGVEYFSLLRPLSELQIARLFARYGEYHAIFRSCNAASKLDQWCGSCPKCLFVYIILSPFLDDAALVSIFQKNLFEDIRLKGMLDELAGFTPEKPFECVGSRSEVRAALDMVLAGYDIDSPERDMPPLLAHYRKKRGNNPQNTERALMGFDARNAVPPRFQELLLIGG